MPQWPWRRRPPAPAEHVARVAAAQAVTPAFTRTQPRTRQPWQQRARFFSEHLGLIRFANGLMAQTAARCELRVEKLVDPVRRQWEPADDDPVLSEVLETYQGRDADSPSDLVARQVWHYQGTGECYLIVEADEAGGGLSWSVRSTQAVRWQNNGALVMDLPGGSERDGTARLLPLEVVRRMWVPDDEWSAYAKSPMKGVIADCERYWALARRIRREAESTLVNGFMFTPGYAHTPITPPNPQRPGDDPGTKLARDYYRIAEAAFGDDDSVAAVAPWELHYDSRDPQKDPMPPQFIYPGRMLDPHGIEHRTEAVESIARGLDLPQRLVVQGPGEGNHWSDWLVQESFFTSALAPTMDRVTHADLTAAFFRPVIRELVARGRWLGNPDIYRVGYDPAPVIVHPDKASSSISLYGLGALKLAVVLEANGFNASDAPDPSELARILEVMRVVHGRQVTQAGEPLPGGQSGPVSPSSTRELPPSPALTAIGAALGPYPTELGTWLDG